MKPLLFCLVLCLCATSRAEAGLLSRLFGCRSCKPAAMKPKPSGCVECRKHGVDENGYRIKK